MKNLTIGEHINKLMVFYASYSDLVTQIPDASAAEVDDMRQRRNTVKRWIKQHLMALEEMGIDVKEMQSMKW
jgi:hypothetical protein